ncbi:unnamed protein product, partial [Rotaria socialis]
PKFVILRNIDSPRKRSSDPVAWFFEGLSIGYPPIYLTKKKLKMIQYQCKTMRIEPQHHKLD